MVRAARREPIPAMDAVLSAHYARLHGVCRPLSSFEKTNVILAETGMPDALRLKSRAREVAPDWMQPSRGL